MHSFIFLTCCIFYNSYIKVAIIDYGTTHVQELSLLTLLCARRVGFLKAVECHAMIVVQVGIETRPNRDKEWNSRLKEFCRIRVLNFFFLNIQKNTCNGVLFFRNRTILQLYSCESYQDSFSFECDYMADPGGK